MVSTIAWEFVSRFFILNVWVFGKVQSVLIVSMRRMFGLVMFGLGYCTIRNDHEITNIQSLPLQPLIGFIYPLLIYLLTLL